jgi:hypothetical protein
MMVSFLTLLSLALFAASSFADWTTQKWDTIIVGAGPAGIIGELPSSGDGDHELRSSQSQIVWRQQVSKRYCLKSEDPRMV